MERVLVMGGSTKMGERNPNHKKIIYFSYEDKKYIKIVAVDEIYKFVVQFFFYHLRLFKCKKFITNLL